MACRFCERNDNVFVPMNQTKQHSGIEVMMNRQGILRVRTFDLETNPDAEGAFVSQDTMNMPFCPVCGRKIVTITLKKASKEDM